MEILLDCDGVLADFLSSALDRLNAATGKGISVSEYVTHQTWDIERVYGLSSNDFWRIIEEGDSLWCNLKIFPWASDVLELCRSKGRVTICTSPSLNPLCSSQKTQWLMDNLGIKNTDVMIGSRKELMAKTGNTLIDDSPSNIRKFEQAGGRGILIPSNWNTYPLTSDRVMKSLEVL